MTVFICLYRDWRTIDADSRQVSAVEAAGLCLDDDQRILPLLVSNSSIFLDCGFGLFEQIFSSCVEIFVVIQRQLVRFSLQLGLDCLRVGALEPQYQRLDHGYVGCRLQDAIGKDIAPLIIAANIYENRLDFWIVAQKFEGFEDLFHIGTSADVKEIDRLGPAMKFQ